MADYTLGVQIEGDASGLERAAKQGSDAIKGLEAQSDKSAQSMSQKFGAASKTAGDLARVFAPISAAAASGLGYSTKVTADFNAEMSKVQAISGATASDMELLESKANELGKNTKFSTTQAAQAYEYMAMAGWKTGDMLNGVAGIMNLAAASGEDLGTTSDIVTDALTAFGMSAEDSSRFADVLAAASSNANTNVSMLGESFKYVAPVAGALGYSAEDTSVALGLMANAGIKASSAGTSLRTMLTNMAKPTDDMAHAMDVLGVSLDDGEGNMKSFREVMGELRSGFGDLMISEDEYKQRLSEIEKAYADGEMSEKQYGEALEELIGLAYGAEGAEKAKYAAMLAGKTGMSGLLAIVGATEEDYNKLCDAIDGASETMVRTTDGSIIPMSQALAEGKEWTDEFAGSAEAMANTMNNNLSGDMTLLGSSAELLGKRIGEIMEPYQRKGAQDMTDFVNRLAEMDDGTLKVITVIGLVVASIAPLLLAISLVTKGVSVVMTTLEPLGAALAGISAPILIIIAVIALLVAAFITLWNTNEEFRNSITTIWTELQTIFGDFFTELFAKFEEWGLTTENFKAAWEMFCNFLAPILVAAFELIKNNIQFALDFILGLLTIFHGLFTGNWDEVWEGAKQILDAAKTFLTNVFGDLVEKLKEKATELKDKIHEKFTELKDKATEKVEELKEKAKEKFVDMVRGVLCEIAEFVHDTKEKFDEIKQGVEEKVDNVRQAIEDGFNNAVDFVKGLIDDAWNWGSDLVSNIADGIWSGIGWITDAVSSIADTISSFLHFSEPDVGPLANFHTYMPDMMKQLSEGMKEGLPTLRAGVELVADTVAGVIPGTGTAGRYGGQGDRVNNMGGVYITVNGAPGQDEEGIADAVMRRIMDLVIADS